MSSGLRSRRDRGLTALIEGSRHPSLRRRLAALTAVAASAAVLAGCSPGVTTAPAPTSPPITPAAQGVEQQFVQVVEQVGPSVVLVTTDQGLGSGIVFDAQGNIVTNNHVVAGAHRFQVTAADGTHGLKPATFADSTSLAVGDLVLAIGNPLGLQSSVTEGIVSALGRTVNEDNGVALPNVIQTSAAINPGNSGGALVNLQGQVAGIPTVAAVDPQLGGGAAPGIGFAIPSNIVKNVATQLIDTGTVTNSNRAYLGVQGGTTTGGGVLVSQLQPGGPAAQAGISTGDVITAVNGSATPDTTTLADVLAGLKPGQAVSVSITRPDGTAQTLQVALAQSPG